MPQRPPVRLAAPLLVVLASCAQLAPPSVADVSLPVGTRAEMVRVLLPAKRQAADACLTQCAELERVRSAYQSCLARCPGARLEVGQSCGRPNRDRCFERVVAVPVQTDHAVERDVATTTLGAVLVMAVLSAHIAVAVLCDDYSQLRSCGEDDGL